jgi:hypothetical protein
MVHSSSTLLRPLSLNAITLIRLDFKCTEGQIIFNFIVCNLLLKLSGRGMENILLELAVHEIHEYKFRIGFLLLCIHYSVFWREGEGGKLNIILPSVHLKSSLIRVMAFNESGLRRVEQWTKAYSKQSTTDDTRINYLPLYFTTWIISLTKGVV